MKMKVLMIGALLAGQCLTVAQPALAVALSENRSSEIGAFAGMRIRVPLDGPRHERQLRAGLMIAPTLHSRNADGGRMVRLGEGVELGVRGREPIQLSIGGHDFARLADDEAAQADDDGGIPTWAIVAGSVALVAGIAFAVYVQVGREASD